MHEGLFQPMHLMLLVVLLGVAACTFFWVLMLVESFPKGAVSSPRQYHWFAAIASTWVFGAIAYWLWSRQPDRSSAR